MQPERSSSRVIMSSPDSELEADSVVTDTNEIVRNSLKNVHFNPFEHNTASTSTRKPSMFAKLHGTLKVQIHKRIAMQRASCAKKDMKDVSLSLGVKRLGESRILKYRKDHDTLRKCVQYKTICKTMFTATAFNNTDCMKEMLSKGHSPNIWESNGRTLLHIAARRGYAAMVRILLAHGADPNAITCQGRTPLHLAIMATHNVAVVTLLLEAGTNIFATDKYGQSALQLAHNKLKEYCRYSADDFHRLKEVMRNIVTILVLFLKKQDAYEEEILELSSRICQLDTSDHLHDDVKNLLAKLDTLNI